jgi:hypothetical protein
MSFGRLILIVLALGAVFYLYKHSTRAMAPASDESVGSPLDRARAAAKQTSDRAGQTDAIKSQADSPAGTVSENMTPDQVRALLGSPDEVKSETTDTGVKRETWTYRSAGKTVLFENGVAVSVR